MERKRTTKTSGKSPWTIADVAGPQGDRGADPTDGERRRGGEEDREQSPGDAAGYLRPEDQADRQEPQRGEEAERRGSDQPA